MTATRSHDELERIWSSSPGIWGFLTSVNHKHVGLKYIVTAFIFFLVGGTLALLMRTQLIRPNNEFLGPDTYNELFTMHGTTMMFLFAVPMVEGIGTYFVPLMIGARDMVFPRLNAFGYWCFALGGIFLYSSFAVGEVPDGGWFAYVPLTSSEFSPGMGMDFWLLGITFVEISGLVAALELTVTVLKGRAPGMALTRMPIFVWAILVMSVAIILGFPPLIVGSAMLELDRSVGTTFFIPEGGGSPLLWQHLFWTFGHPEVYIQFLPAVGVISMVIPVFSARPIVAYFFVVMAVILTGMLSFHLWVHHMFAVDLPAIALAFFMVASIAIAIPSGVQIFAWIATLWGGRPIWSPPLLFALAFILIFVVGGITGVMVALVPLDWQVHDSYFVVAHFHYVLIGGVVFPIFAGFYYWFPKVTGRMLSERLAWVNFAFVFIGFNVAFFLMHITGLLGMPRRVYTYPSDAGWSGLNLWQSIGAYMIGFGMLVFVVNVVYSLFRGRLAPDDPWGGNTLEWATSSPPPGYNFATIPSVQSRDPLWDEHPVRQEQQSFLAEPINDLRLALTTTVLDARAERISWLPKPSLVPLLLALAVGIVFLGALIKSFWLIVPGLIAVAALAVIWSWPDEEELWVFENETLKIDGLPLEETGRGDSTYWGMLIFIGILLAAVVTFTASYYYLWSGVDAWPPDGVTKPEFIVPTLASASLVLTAIPTYWARRRASVQPEYGLNPALSLALILGLGFIGGALWYERGIDVGATDSSYGSIFYTFGGFLVVMTAVGVGMLLHALVRGVRVGYTPLRHQTVAEVGLYWYFLAGTGALGYLVLILSPHFL